MCTFLHELLAGEEGLGLSTGGVGAQRTAEGQLARTNHVGLQVGLDQVCQSLDRRRAETGLLLLPYYHSNCSELQPLMKRLSSRSHARAAALGHRAFSWIQAQHKVATRRHVVRGRGGGCRGTLSFHNGEALTERQKRETQQHTGNSNHTKETSN